MKSTATLIKESKAARKKLGAFKNLDHEIGIALGRAQARREAMVDCEECGLPVPFGATICGNCRAKLMDFAPSRFERRDYYADKVERGEVECPF